MKKILYVHPDETIAYLIDRIENTDSDILFIVADANAALFMDSVNLKLLKREADGFGKQCVIVSQDQAITNIAREAGFDTSSEDISMEESGYGTPRDMHSESAPSGAESEEAVTVHVRHYESENDFSRISSKIPPERNDSPSMSSPDTDDATQSDESAGEPEDVAFNVGEYRSASQRSFGVPLNWKFLGVSLSGVAVIAVAGFYFFSSTLIVSIIPKKETLNFDFQVVADLALSSVNAVKARVPGQIVKIDQEASDAFPATGKQDKETKAEGDMVIYNAFGLNVQTLVKNTRFKAKDGKIFRLVNAVTIPGAKMDGGKIVTPGTVNARVVADQPGAVYNIDPTEFSIPGFADTTKFLGFYGKSQKPMSGGGSSNARFATREDLDKAKAALSASMAKNAESFVASKIPKGLKTIAKSFSQEEPQLTTGLVDAGGTFKATLKTTHAVFAFSENDIIALIDYAVSGRLSERRKAVAQTRVISYIDEVISQDKKSFTFTAKVSELVLGIINDNDVRRLLAGKNESEIRQILGANESIESAEITFWPLWASVAPSNPDTIKVSVDES